MPSQTVTLEAAEWQQVMAIIANSTGYVTVSKLFQQLQEQSAGDSRADRPNGPDSQPPDNWPDPQNLPPTRRVPRA